MNKENASKLWKIIQEAGDYLEGQLPDHPNHPKGRNPYAHVAICIKSKFNASYKDIEDEKFEEIVKNWETLQDYINLNKQTNFVKTHNAMCTVGSYKFTTSKNTIGAIYLIRDPRDVLVSHFFSVMMSHPVNSIKLIKMREKYKKIINLFVITVAI